MAFSFLKPKNSIIFCFDYGGDSTFSDFQEALSGARKYYEPSRLSEIVSRLNSKTHQGYLGVALMAARVGVLDEVVPYLRDEQIPFTVFLHVDCIGLNRLPWAEELAEYRNHYGSIVDTCLNQWDGSQGNPRAHLQKFVGPLPVEGLNPKSFFMTWGKLLQMDSKLWEPGMVLASDFENSMDLVGKQRYFAAGQLSQQPTIASVETVVHHPQALETAGFTGAMGPLYGAINKKTNPYQLTKWEWNENQEKSKN